MRDDDCCGDAALEQHLTAADLDVMPDDGHRYEPIDGVNLPGAPLLAVEPLSPSTRRFDLILKRSRSEAAGCEHYWVIDPLDPRIIAWALQDGRYVEVARASGDKEILLESPVRSGRAGG